MLKKLNSKIRKAKRIKIKPKKVDKTGISKKEVEKPKISVYKVRANCYNGGRVHEFLRKEKGALRDFSCCGGVVNFTCDGVSNVEICRIMQKCGGENVEISDVGKVARAKKNLPIIVGVFVFCVVIFLSNLFVLDVDVFGEDEVLKVHIQNVADDIYPFMALKSEKKLEKLKSEISGNKDVAFYNVEVIQNKIRIDFLKSQNGEVILCEKSILSPENGTLLSISTLSGRSVKSVGDKVLKGEVLIVAETNGENPQPISKAMGSGVLLAEKTASFTLPQIAEEKTYTGESEKSWHFVICGKKIFGGKSDFENYTSKIITKALTKNIQIVCETRNEYTSSTVVRSQEELEQMAKEIFKSRYLSNFAYTITDIKTTSEMDGDSCVVRVGCEYLLEF